MEVVRWADGRERVHACIAGRSVASPGELACSVCFGPEETASDKTVKVAGSRWAIEEAKEGVGPQQY